jgi:peptidoglycan/LPS O-acetylase OafA/YrhL
MVPFVVGWFARDSKLLAKVPSFLLTLTGTSLLTCGYFPWYSVVKGSPVQDYDEITTLVYGLLFRPLFSVGVWFLYSAMTRIEVHQVKVGRGLLSLLKHVIVNFGEASYAFFLIHPLVLGGIFSVVPTATQFSWWWYGPFVCASLIFVSFVSRLVYQYVERPLLALMTLF